MKILFVCTGNVVRSFTAQELLSAYHRNFAGNKFLEINSAGVSAESYFKIPQQVIKFLKSQSIENFNHVPKLVTEELVDWADIILVMEDWHYDVIADKYPQSMRKMRLFLDFATGNNINLADPMGKSDEHLNKTFLTIKDSIRKIFDKLLKTAGSV